MYGIPLFVFKKKGGRYKFTYTDIEIYLNPWSGTCLKKTFAGEYTLLQCITALSVSWRILLWPSVYVSLHGMRSP